MANEDNRFLSDKGGSALVKKIKKIIHSIPKFKCVDVTIAEYNALKAAGKINEDIYYNVYDDTLDIPIQTLSINGQPLVPDENGNVNLTTQKLSEATYEAIPNQSVEDWFSDDSI